MHIELGCIRQDLILTFYDLLVFSNDPALQGGELLPPGYFAQ